MPKKNVEREGWKNEIRAKLDMSPKTLVELRNEWDFAKFHSESLTLLDVVSGMQGTNKPEISTAFNKNNQKYLLYLTKQRSNLIEEGLLLEKWLGFEVNIESNRYGNGRPRIRVGFGGKER